MRESFSKPEQFSKEQARQEINEGIADYLFSKNPDKEVELSTIETFETTTAEEPLGRKDFESNIENFVDGNFAELLPLLTSGKNRGEIIKQLKLSNEQIGLLGANYFIREQNGKLGIYQTDEYYPDGRYVSEDTISNNDLLALAYVRDAVRIDTARDVGKAKKTVPHRYYFKPQSRYLCSNDFGMRTWDEEEKKMADGDVTNLGPFISTAKKEFERISKNIETVGVEKATESDANRKLVLSAISRDRVEKMFVFKADEIAKKAGFTDLDKIDLGRVFSPPSPEAQEATIKSARFTPFHKPILFSPEGDGQFLDFCKTRVKEAIARKAIEDNPKLKEVFEQCRCKRNINSGVYYSDADVYEILRAVDAESALAFFKDSDQGIGEKLHGLEILRNLGYKLQNFEGPNLGKQSHQAATLSRTGIWSYLGKREVGEQQETQDQYQRERQNEKWLAKLPVRKGRDLFREGKRMHWLAKQVWMANPDRKEENRFYRQDQYVNWDRYDISKADVPEEKLNEYLEKQKNLIVALLGQGSENRYGQQPEQGKSATLGLIIQALEQGNDIRGVALAHDKQRYLEGVIGGQVKNDLEFATEDWPADWRKAVSPEEINLYYEYASDYVLLDPNGLTKYATWRASNEGKEWDNVFKETPKRKTDLDFRICLGTQTEEVRTWYKGAAEHVGGSAMQNYLLRFNTTRGADGRIANWHDVLLWSPNIQKLEAGDAKSILLSIETMDDNQEFVNLLPRYSKDRDPLQATGGSIQSLRELKKRILAIESNIDLSKFPPELLDIISAPGFNLAALESMRRRADFQDLLDGKLDKEQPFRPHSRTFAGRTLTEALREGLGSYKQKIRGTAKDSKGLFHSLNQLVKDREVGEKKMTALDLLNSVPTDLEEDIIRLLREQQVDVGPIVEARVHDKSDPEGWVCGNYTDCCMPFGDSKNDDYIFNRSTQYFTIKYNGRIVAQSVVVDSRNQENNEDVIVLDNIEVANNYKNLSPLLANVYQTFWTEYTSKPVKVGTGYSDLTPPGGKLEPNKYQAKTRLSWSDATGSQIYDLPKRSGVESMDKVVTFANLSERDAELIAKMEAEAYPEGMAQGKAHVAEILQKQRDLEVPGAASSFVVRQGSEAAGYLLVLPEESEVKSGERVAHVYDMVVLPKFRGSPIARKMMERVLDVASAYGVPIEAEARASTSYALLMNERIRKWFESKGFYLTKNEKLPAYLNGEDFYFVRFENRQNAEATA
ncbi:MAG: GNAT family N-acetyltransferase [Nanoarchaeota archaeon]